MAGTARAATRKKIRSNDPVSGPLGNPKRLRAVKAQIEAEQEHTHLHEGEQTQLAPEVEEAVRVIAMLRAPIQQALNDANDSNFKAFQTMREIGVMLGTCEVDASQVDSHAIKEAIRKLQTRVRRRPSRREEIEPVCGRSMMVHSKDGPTSNHTCVKPLSHTEAPGDKQHSDEFGNEWVAD